MTIAGSTTAFCWLCYTESIARVARMLEDQPGLRKELLRAAEAHRDRASLHAGHALHAGRKLATP